MAVLAISLVLIAVGCNKPRKRVLTKEQANTIEASILKSEPKPQKAIGAVLDETLELIGLDVSAQEVKVGGSFKVAYYWRVLKDIPPGGWKIFVHLDGSKRTNHDHQGVGELYAVSKWKKGQIIKDEQTIDVAKDYKNGTARLLIGIYDESAYRERKQNIRMKVTNRSAVKVPVGSDDRIEVARVRLTGGTAAAPKRPAARTGAKLGPKKYTAGHIAGAAVTVDGKLDELAWRKARPTPPFVSPTGQRGDVKLLTQARMTWDDTNLYLGFTTRDQDIFSDRKGRDAKLWERDCVEIYLDPGADGRDYVELQISPNEDIFDAHFTTRRKPAWAEAAKKLTLSAMTAKVQVAGTANKQDDKDRQWTVETAIPWAQLPGVSGPPKEGETWAVNLYRIDAGTPNKRATHLAWTPAGNDFHNLPGFGKVTFTRKALPGRTAPTRMLTPQGRRPAPGALAPGRSAPKAVAPRVKRGAPLKPAGPGAMAKPAPAGKPAAVKRGKTPAPAAKKPTAQPKKK